MATSKQQQADRQVETSTTGELFEVLTQAPNGHRTVHRLRAKDRATAEKQVGTDGGKVIGTSVAGAGLGSGDAA